MDSPNPPEPSALATLWRRAPLWRATLVAAFVLTLTAAVLWAESQQKEPLALAPGVSVSAEAKAAPASQDPLRRSAGADAPASGASLLDDVRLLGTPAAEPVSDEEEQVLATCHPHLLRTPASMPQIDVANVSEPNLGHVKFHFWVNGAGIVTREILTEATLGTSAEREAEAAYAKELTFSLPNTKECRSREVEVIGDFFEQRERSGRWATYVRLYPHLSFGNTGALERRD